jgi:hypothetical protein
MPPCLLAASKATAVSSSVLVTAASLWIAPLTASSPLLEGLRAPPCLGPAPQHPVASPSTSESHRTIAAPVSFHPDVAPLHWPVSRANTLLHRRTVVHGRPPENLHADGPAAGRICPHHELCAPSSRQSGHHAGSTSCVGGDMGHPCAALWAVHDACTMRVGRPCRFRPMDSGLNKKIICYLF